MYKKIEQEYKREINIENSKTIELILIISFIISSILFRKIWWLQVVVLLLINVSVFLVVYLFWCKNKRVDKKFRIIRNVKNAIKAKQENNYKIFREVLRENNINTQEQLREVMEYYKLKIPSRNKINIVSCLWGTGITVLTILLACINVDQNGIDILNTIPLLSFGMAFIILLAFLIVVVTTCKDLYIDLFDKYDVSENFVEMLSWELVQIQGKKCEKDNKISARKNKK